MMTTPDSGLHRAGFVLVAFSLAMTPLGLFYAQAGLYAAVVLWLVVTARNGRWRDLPAFTRPLVAYGVWTFVSAAASVNPMASFADTKQLLLFLMVPAVATFARGSRATRVVDSIIAAGSGAALYGIVQYSLLGYDTLENRAVGFLGHWMTFSGVLMLITGAALARLLYAGREWIWPAIAVPALVVALFYTYTRNAMVGLVAAIGVLMAEKNWRLLLALPVLGLIFLVIAPSAIISRVQSIGDLNDPSNRDRFAMLRSGVRMVQDHPLTGVGPDSVKLVYAQYRDAIYAVDDRINPHLHNVPMQIAAERGLPALALWLWFVVVASRDLWRQLRTGEHRAVAGAGV
ncbi:MAG TPA: O-antigen ligase family protein, partial [Vicinamibacterales bacterium]|nr:O-antigen ligase family protein [Vicinamibacterales bacterium]